MAKWVGVLHLKFMTISQFHYYAVFRAINLSFMTYKNTCIKNTPPKNSLMLKMINPFLMPTAIGRDKMDRLGGWRLNPGNLVWVSFNKENPLGFVRIKKIFGIFKYSTNLRSLTSLTLTFSTTWSPKCSTGFSCGNCYRSQCP